jgi:glycosyltransferase involved in cell wall biosynthesis
MNLLVITNNLHNASFRQRIKLHLPALRDYGFDCEVARLPRGSLARRRLFKRAAEFGGVLMHKKPLNPCDAFFLRRYSRRIVYDFDDAVMYNPNAPDRDNGRRFRAFRRTVRLADLVIAGNDYLAEHAGAHNPNVRVVPTGLDTQAYKEQVRPESDGKTRLVWIGGRATLPFLQQIGPALEQVGARSPNVVLRIICDTFFHLRHLAVEQRQWSLHGQLPDLVSADIGLAPLPDNRYTRGKCGFKILQYAAAGLPIVASPVGVNADYVRSGTTGLHATEVSDWVEGIGQLLEDRQLRERMGRAGQNAIQRFDLGAVGQQLVRTVDENLRGSG